MTSESTTTPLPVVVTGVGGGGFGEQILKALRLAATPYELIGTDTTKRSAGFARVDHAYVVPAAVDEGYVAAMAGICARHRARALFAGSEPELRAIARHRRQFEEAGVFIPVNSDAVLDTCLDKERTMRFLGEHGFHAPRTFRINGEDDLEGVDVFPVILKPNSGGGGSADVYIAQNRDELLAFGRYLLAGGRNVLAQEYVGTPDKEFTVGVLSSMSGEVINSVAVRRFTTAALSNRVKIRNRSGRADLGEILVVSSGISQGEIGRFPDVTGPCEAIAVALSSRGPLNIQCRVVDGSVVVFEINPRFSGTTSLRALIGYNEPDLLIREHVLGTPVERRFSYRSAVILRGLDEIVVDERRVVNAADA